MSGILSSLSNVVSQSRLSRAGHKLLLKSANSVLHPTAYYYQGIRTQHQRLALPQDIFELSLVCNALTRQSNMYLSLLSETEIESVHQEILTRVETNTSEINTNIEDIIKLFKQGRTEFPIQSVADILYTLAHSSSTTPSSLKQLTPTLFAILHEKLAYLSVHNGQDILTSLVKLNLASSNADLIKKILAVLSTKDFPYQLEPVLNHAWTINQYEEPSNTHRPLNIINCRENNFAAYIRAGGNTSPLAKAKLSFQAILDQLIYKVINPFFFRETRINKRFEARNEEEDTSVFASTLSAILTTLPETAALVNQIQAKI